MITTELENLFDDIVEIMNQKAQKKIAEHTGRILRIDIIDLNFSYAMMATPKGVVRVEPNQVKPTGIASMYFDTFRALFENRLSPDDALAYGFVSFQSQTPIADYLMIVTFLESIGGVKAVV